jgi:hypothetical protein
MHKILTGKCKRTFLKWLKIRVNSKLHEIDNIEFWFNLQDESFKITLIIEWFDSVGIYITSDYFELNNGFYSEILDSNFEIIKPTRQEAIKEAIKEANEIYNSK